MRLALTIMAATMLAGAAPAFASAVTADPPFDTVHPADNVVFTIPVGDGAMNAMMYTAAGAGPHPTLLLLHGFPGNEQNLDLAQAARRAGWNVLTQHYRGSWGSPGNFSFTSAAEDAHAALAYLENPEHAAKLGIDVRRIAIAGHSMGGFMAADVGGDDKSVIGLFLIDPGDLGDIGRTLGDAAVAQGWHEEVVGDLPPLNGTSEAALTEEIRTNADRFDLTKRLIAYGSRPLDIVGAKRALGPHSAVVLKAVRASANPAATGATWPTDHSFNDRRIALAERLVAWLDSLPRPR